MSTWSGNFYRALGYVDIAVSFRKEPRRFYRVKEAAAIMGVPTRTMYHLAETGQIPCLRLGTVILVPVAWVEREPLAPAKR